MKVQWKCTEEIKNKWKFESQNMKYPFELQVGHGGDMKFYFKEMYKDCTQPVEGINPFCACMNIIT